MKRKITFTHNGSVWKSLWLLLRSLCNIASFGFFWYGLISGNITVIVAGTVVLTVLVMLNLIFPALKK